MAEIKTVMTADTSQFETSMKRAQRTATSSTTGMQKGFSTLGSSLGALAVKVGAAAGAVGIAFAVIKSSIGDNVNLARYSFDKLADAAKTDSEILLTSIRAASNGVVSDFDLMQAAARGMVLGLRPDALVKFMEIAAASSKATGQTVTQAFDDIVVGTARQSRMILDNLGIIVKVEDANKKYAASLGISTSALTDTMKKQAFMNAVMEAGEIQIKTLGSTTAGTFNETAKLMTSLKNTWNGFSTALLSVFEGLSTVANRIFSTFDKVKTTISNLKSGGLSGLLGGGYQSIGTTDRSASVTTAKSAAVADIPKGPMSGTSDGALDAQAANAERMATQIKKINDSINAQLELADKDSYEKRAIQAEQARDKQKASAMGDAKTLLNIEKAYNQTVKEITEDRAREVMNSVGAIQSQGLKSEYDQNLIQLAAWNRDLIDMAGEDAELRSEITEAYNQRKMELERDYELEIANEIKSIRDDSHLSQQELELEQLDEWHSRMMELTINNEEQKLEVEAAYAERRAELKAEEQEAVIEKETTFYDTMGAMSQKTAQFETDVQKTKFGILQQLGSAAVEYGGKTGKKLFLITQSVAAAEAIVSTYSAVMKTMASTPYPYNIPLAAAQAAIGAAHVASIMSTAVGSTSTTSTSSSGGTSSYSSSSSLNDVSADSTSSDDEALSSTLTINIEGDIMNEDYVDLLAARLSEAVDERNIVLKSSQSREVTT